MKSTARQLNEARKKKGGGEGEGLSKGGGTACCSDLDDGLDGLAGQKRLASPYRVDGGIGAGRLMWGGGL